jgi:hypothetical protein
LYFMFATSHLIFHNALIIPFFLSILFYVNSIFKAYVLSFLPLLKNITKFLIIYTMAFGLYF